MEGTLLFRCELPTRLADAQHVKTLSIWRMNHRYSPQICFFLTVSSGCFLNHLHTTKSRVIFFSKPHLLQDISTLTIQMRAQVFKENFACWDYQSVHCAWKSFHPSGICCDLNKLQRSKLIDFLVQASGPSWEGVHGGGREVAPGTWWCVLMAPLTWNSSFCRWCVTNQYVPHQPVPVYSTRGNPLLGHLGNELFKEACDPRSSDGTPDDVFPR